MTVDNQKKRTVEPEFIETLEAVDMFIEQCNIRNVILAGDLNIDFNKTNAHNLYFKDFSIRKDFTYVFDK